MNSFVCRFCFLPVLMGFFKETASKKWGSSLPICQVPTLFSIWLLCLTVLILACNGQKADASPDTLTLVDVGANMQLPEGFSVEVVADSTLIDYPMFCSLDESGRLFVFEASGNVYDSAKEVVTDPQFRIRMLQDIDHDGKYDSSIIFADRVGFPQGGVFYKGSLYATSAPDVLKLTDTDNDGMADKREVLVSGWNLWVGANSIIGPELAPDGYLYMTSAIHGFDVTTREGKRLTGKTSRIWRMHPDGSGLEWVSAGGMNNPVELTFTEAGEPIGTETYFTDPQAGLRDALVYWTEGGVYPKPNENIAQDSLVRTGELLSVITKFSRVAPSGIMRYRSRGLIGFSENVYVHVGVITNLSTSGADWRHVVFTWGSTNAAAQATPDGVNKWKYTIINIRSFFSVQAGETILKIAILFRDGPGNIVQRNSDGSDMYVPIYDNNLAVRFSEPPFEPRFDPVPEPINKQIGDSISITGLASQVSDMKLYLNGVAINSVSSVTSISSSPTIAAAGNTEIVLEAKAGIVTKRDTLNFFVAPSVTVAPLPLGVKDGINYAANNTEVTLVLYAPGKTRVSVIGEFAGNNWSEQSQYLMKNTPDGNYWWLTITGLTSGSEYAYQYLVDGNLKIADPYAEKILDEGNDKFIPAATYPGLKPYPVGKTSGIVSVLQTNPPSYSWAVNNFSRPDKRNLVIYELLVRDFIALHDWKTLKDTLNYLKALGVNAIEVMPFNEFGGNESWGYNPFQFFAPDKYYGSKNRLKEFIDTCHKNGVAVIMDIVLNHTYGASPLAQLYWDATNNRPAASNPWYNAVAPTAFGFGDDFNHESAATKYFFSRVLQHWLVEYKLDGYRFDFSKGLTQKPSANDAGFSAHDASRIAIINRYADTVKAIYPDAYIILEHFCADPEEKGLQFSISFHLPVH